MTHKVNESVTGKLKKNGKEVSRIQFSKVISKPVEINNAARVFRLICH